MLPGKLPATTPQAADAPNGGPPPNADGSKLWIKLSALPRPVSKEHTLRAKGQDVGTLVFWVLTSGELSHTFIKAEEATAVAFRDPGAKGTVAYQEHYENQKALHLLQLCCRQPEEPRFPVFMNVKDVREHLTDDEASVVLAAYNIFRKESGPIISDLTPEAMDAWIDVLREGASRHPLAHCSLELLSDLLMYAVSKIPLPESSTATSSAGAQLDTPSTQSHDAAADGTEPIP